MAGAVGRGCTAADRRQTNAKARITLKSNSNSSDQRREAQGDTACERTGSVLGQLQDGGTLGGCRRGKRRSAKRRLFSRTRWGMRPCATRATRWYRVGRRRGGRRTGGDGRFCGNTTPVRRERGGVNGQRQGSSLSQRRPAVEARQQERERVSGSGDQAMATLRWQAPLITSRHGRRLCVSWR